MNKYPNFCWHKEAVLEEQMCLSEEICDVLSQYEETLKSKHILETLIALSRRYKYWAIIENEEEEKDLDDLFNKMKIKFGNAK